MSSTTVVLPTLNERKGVEKTIEDIRDYEDEFDLEEILVVDGESTDGTREKARELGARVVVEERKGYGRAYKTGFEEAKGDIIVTLDADHTYPAKHIPEMVELIEEGNRFVTTSRDKDGFNLKSRVGNWGLNLWRKLTHPFSDIKDSQSGMWAMDSDLPTDLSLSSDGMPFSEEIKLKAERCYSMEEIDIFYRERVGDVKLNAFSDGVKNVKKYIHLHTEEYNSKKTILVANKYDWKHPNQGGAEVNLENTLKRLAERGHSVHLFTSRYPDSEEYEVDEGVQIHRYGMESRTNEILIHTLGQLNFNLMIQKIKPDVIYSINSPFPWLKLTSRKKVTMFHHLNHKVFFKAFDFPLNWCAYLFEKAGVKLSRWSEVISVSPSTTEDLVNRGIPRNKITEIKNGIDYNKYEPNGNWENPRVTYIGRLEQSKGVDRLPEIYQQICEKFGEKVKLDIAGDGREKDMIRDFSENHDEVNYHGYVSEEKKEELLKKSWVNIVPSRREGWGLTVMEANASGTPVVAFRNGGLTDSVKPDQTGQLVHNPHMEEFGEEVADILNDEEYRDRLSENARKWAEKHDWNETTDRLEQVF